MLPIKKVLVARDLSACSENALLYALALARRLHAALHVLFVEVPQGDTVEAADLDLSAAALRERLGRVVAPSDLHAFDPGGVPITSVVVRGTTAAPVILDYAREQDVDLIVMGTHGRRGLPHLFLGSTAEEVVRRSVCPVLTVGSTARAPHEFASLQALLVPIDFSRYAGEALHYAKELAALFGARLDLLHVVDAHYQPRYVDAGLLSLYDVEPDVAEKAIARLNEVYYEVGGPTGPAVRAEVRTGPAAQEIVDYAAQNGSSLIVMATHGLSGLNRVLIGSVAEKVVRTAPCPVCTIMHASEVPADPVSAARRTARA